MFYRKAFTLVELLVTVAILAILLMISIPFFHSNTKSAARSTTIANHNLIVTAVAIYWHENHLLPSSPCDISPFLPNTICEPCSICSAPGLNDNPAGSVYKMFFESISTDTFLVITAELDGVLVATWREKV